MYVNNKDKLIEVKTKFYYFSFKQYHDQMKWPPAVII